MTTPYWTTTVTAIGPDAPELLAGGVLILFGEQVPPALAEVSVLHRPDGEPGRELRAGDVLAIDGREHPIGKVGEQAAANLRELGHVVLYADAGEQALLPGAVHVSGQVEAPAIGSVITLSGS